MDDKKTVEIPAEKKPEPPAEPADSWCEDMKQELEDYIEEQGIYIRQ